MQGSLTRMCTLSRARSRRWLVLVLWSAGAVAQQAGPASPKGQSEAAPPTVVEVAPVLIEPAREEIGVVGNLMAEESVTLRPEVAGRLASIDFEEGQAVEKGQTLFTLDPAEFQAEVARTEAATRLWELKYERARDLLERKVMSQQEYDESLAQLQTARAQLALERVRLAKTKLVAPISGIIGLRQVSPGDYVEAGHAMVNLEAVDPVKIDFNVPERYSAVLSAGQRFTVRVEAYPEREFAGEVYAIDPRLDEAGRTLRARGRIANTDMALRPGMFAQVRITLATRERAVWVPEEAIVPRGGEQFVFRVQEGRAALTRVRLGVREVGRVEVVDGLKEGDTVITAGHTMLRDNASIRIVNLPVTAAPGA